MTTDLEYRILFQAYTPSRHAVSWAAVFFHAVWYMASGSLEICRVGCSEDHSSGFKWSITMVLVSPVSGAVGPLPNGLQ